MTSVESLLQERIGLDAASVGSSVIERTVRLRMKGLGLKESGDYARLLESPNGAAEWEELVESVVVTETWFFRDRSPFTALVELVQQEWLPQHPTGALRLLSVPCSSGEEPFSLAMALLDGGVAPERFAIDGLDVSERALARARKGVYGKNSFRGKELDFREKYFQATKDGFVLHPRVRERVRFQRANIFAEDFPGGRAAYDFVFCRNLLIYFGGEARTAALDKLTRLLSPQGVLFVGPAELPLATAHGFVSANVPMAFACRKTGDALAPAATGRPAKRDITRPKVTAQPVRFEAQPTPSVEASHSPPVRGARTSQADLAAARQLADAGKLAEAAAICQAHLDRQGPTAQAYYLLGLVHDADPDPALSGQAMDLYRKALYLEPDHYESLLQMSLLLEKNGDTTGAITFRRRAERVRQKR